MRGPVVLVQEGFVHEPILKLPDNDDGRNKWLVPDEKGSAAFRFIPSDGRNVMAEFRPFYSVGADTYNRMYFDLAGVYKIRPVGSASLDMRMGWRQFLVCPNRLGSALSWRVAL